MGGTIFISYRRGEDPGFAGRLFDRLEHTFGPQRLFMDVDNIPPGEDFVAVLKAQVAACDVLLALIGRGWLTAADKTGHHRLDNPDDFVRIEIASGLAQGKRVIPVLVDDAMMPRANELPEELMPLARRQAVRIAHDRFRDDAERLARALEKTLANAEARRKADEEERQRRQQEEAEAERRAEAETKRKAAEQGDQDAQFSLGVMYKNSATQSLRSPTERECGAEVNPRDFSEFAVFKDVDAPWCPGMVVIPAGEFLMGSLESDGDSSYERPPHQVMIGHCFALGRYPVTVTEYRRFVEATGRQHDAGMWVWKKKSLGLADWDLVKDASRSWRDPGFAQSDRHPVVGVSWQDAVAYVTWLAREAGEPYRLPSEAEWEYACRTGRTTRYAFGDKITEKDANFGGRVGNTTEVGAYPANPWGLYDMHGNVWEWVEDCFHDNYEGAPADGSAWTDGDGKQSFRIRVLRGGSWDGSVGFLRSAYRGRSGPCYRYYYLGFRVARTLD